MPFVMSGKLNWTWKTLKRRKNFKRIGSGKCMIAAEAEPSDDNIIMPNI